MTEREREETERYRDLQEVVRQLNEKISTVEQQRDDVSASAEKAVRELDEKIDRIAEQCALWSRGELDTMTALAGIHGEVNGFQLPEPGAWERMKAIRSAQTVSLMNRATDQLALIESLLEREGVSFVNTHAKQVRDYIELMKGRISAAGERDGEREK